MIDTLMNYGLWIYTAAAIIVYAVIAIRSARLTDDSFCELGCGCFMFGLIMTWASCFDRPGEVLALTTLLLLGLPFAQLIVWIACQAILECRSHWRDQRNPAA